MPHAIVRLLRRLRYAGHVPEARAATTGAAAQQALRGPGAAVRFEADEARAGGVINRGGSGRSGGSGHRRSKRYPLEAERTGNASGPGWWGSAAQACAVRAAADCSVGSRGSMAGQLSGRGRLSMLAGGIPCSQL